jgi:hypothetical protein
VGINDPITEEYRALFNDQDKDKTMFRVVVKNNLTRNMANHLIDSFTSAFELLDAVDFSAIHGVDPSSLRHKDQKRLTNHC